MTTLEELDDLAAGSDVVYIDRCDADAWASKPGFVSVFSYAPYFKYSHHVRPNEMGRIGVTAILLRDGP